MSDDCQREIVELHDFFTAWLGGTSPATDDAFLRFSGVLADGFVYIGPDGNRMEHQGLLDALRGAHGSQPGIGIEIRDARLVCETDDVVVVTYQEWQTTGASPDPEVRLSTVVFRRDVCAPNGLSWQHVHETWHRPEDADARADG